MTVKHVLDSIKILDSYFHCHEVNVQMYSANDDHIEPTRSGQRHFAVSPWACLKGKPHQ